MRSPVSLALPDPVLPFPEAPVFLAPTTLLHASPPVAPAAIILGGGAGSRLFPLTLSRAKPAVPIGGVYRLIDVPMSNCINSGISKIYILTHFNSTSLNRHLGRAYNTGSGELWWGVANFLLTTFFTLPLSHFLSHYFYHTWYLLDPHSW